MYIMPNINYYIDKLKNGYELTKEEINIFQYDTYDMLEIVKIKPTYIKYYRGYDEVVYEEAVKHGYIINEEHIRECSRSSYIMNIAIKNNINYLRYYTGDDISVYINAIKLGYVLKESELSNFSYSPSSMKELIKINPEYIEYYKGYDESVYEEAIKNGYQINDKNIKKCSNSSYIMSIAIKKDINYIKYYTGLDINIYIEAINKGYEMNKKQISRFYDDKESLKKLLQIRPNYIIYYKKDEEDIYKEALKYGYIPKLSDLESNPIMYKIDSIMEVIIKSKPIMIIYYQGTNFDKMLSITNYPKDIPWGVIRFYNGDKEDLIYNYKNIVNFLKICNISKEKFLQYSLGISYNWLNDMKKIFANKNNIDTFLKVKEYFFNNYFTTNNNIDNINNFITILKNYTRYPTICISITQNKEISIEKKKRIEYIFNQSEPFPDQPSTLDNLTNINIKLKNKYLELLTKTKSIDDTKNILCKILFNDTLAECRKKLLIYGNTMELKKLAFNDRKSNIIKELVNELMIYTTMIEGIINTKDEEYLKKVVINILDNYDKYLDCCIIFNNYEEKVRRLYEYDIKEMLTNHKQIKNYDKIIDKEKSKEYGIEVLDFSNKDYIMLAHVRNKNESIDDLVNGISTGNSNFISLSAVSYRNQAYYSSSPTDLIFGYSSIPDGSFICSSIENMGTNDNGSIKRNSLEVNEIVRKQRGILETSSSTYENNSEVLLFREGTKPTCIILANGRKPTEEEIEIAKKYNLKFIITQRKWLGIDNPQNIEYEDNHKEMKNHSNNIEKLREIKNKLINKNNSPRRIAIFTDSHALYEPTLAVLEDIRKKGITEIYSLGDNIGTGPNPREVLDLLNEYNVKSIMGNHESYIVDGVENYQDHLFRSGGYNEAINNSTWTKKELIAEQKESIKLYPKSIELKIGGKKVLLCHSIKDLNTDKLIVNPKEFDEVLQGHIHFEKIEDNIRTLSGVAIGNAGDGIAHYIILTEKPEGGYEIEKKYIEYDVENLKQSINISTLNQKDKIKINNWSKATKRR